MSGKDDSPPPIPVRGSKKGRLQGACDICRRKKVRCDRAKMADKVCSNCIAFNVPCTLTTSAHVPKKPPEEYVAALEARLRSAENFIRQEFPDVEFNRQTGLYESRTTLASGSRHPVASVVDDILERREDSPRLQTIETARQTSVELARYAKTLERDAVRATSRPISDYEPPNSAGSMAQHSLLRDFSDHFEVDDDDEALNAPPGPHRIDDALSEGFSKLELTNTDLRYFGKSSDLSFVHNLVKMRKAVAGASSAGDVVPKSIAKRPEFWSIRPPGIPEPAQPRTHPIYDFPEADLLNHLIHEYFFHVNSLLPLLHYPSFLYAVQEGLHLRDHHFGGVVLMVCALGCLYSNDPRVWKEGVDLPLSRGWKWHDQVTAYTTFQDTYSLYELQTCCLSVLFLNGCSSDKASWIKIGIGIRFAQEVGAHRRKNHRITGEEEMWKRAFWVLICIDRVISSFSGRPCATTEEDFNVDLPLEVDDEYWDHPDPELSWKQPAGKPSRVAHFNSLIRLTKVLALASRTIYAVKRPKLHNNLGLQEWNAHIVSELDAELAKWREELPEHLIFDPHRKDVLFYQQSVSANCSYYLVQMQVHRFFIPNPSQTSLPSLRICADAARACCEILDAQRQRNLISLPYIQVAAFTSGLVLLSSILSSIALRYPVDYEQEMANIAKLIESLKSCEDRWRTAGILRDNLSGLISLGEGGQGASADLTLNAPLHLGGDPRPYLAPIHTSTIGHANGISPTYAGPSRVHLNASSNHVGMSRGAPETYLDIPSHPATIGSTYPVSPSAPYSQGSYSQQYYPNGQASGLPGLQEWWGAYFASVNPSDFASWPSYNPTH